MPQLEGEDAPWGLYLYCKEETESPRTSNDPDEDNSWDSQEVFVSSPCSVSSYPGQELTFKVKKGSSLFKSYVTGSHVPILYSQQSSDES